MSDGDEGAEEFPIEDISIEPQDDAPDDMPTLEAPQETASDDGSAEEPDADEKSPFASQLDDVLPPEPEPIPNVFSPGMDDGPRNPRKKGGSKGPMMFFFIVLFLIVGGAAAAWFMRQTVQDIMPSTTPYYHKLIDFLGLPPEYPGAGIELECPQDQITRETDASGEGSATVVCTLTNLTSQQIRLPNVRVRMTNLNGSIVHKEEIIEPPKDMIDPGEAIVLSPTISGVGRALRVDVDMVKRP